MAVSAARFGQRLACTMAAVHAISRHEHAGAAVADICVALAASSEPALVTAIIQEVSNTDCRELARDASLAKNICNFISELSERLPNVMLGSMSLLLPHLDGDAYVMRNAVVHMLGRVLVLAVGKEKSETATKTRESLLDVLAARTYDVNAFARGKVMQTWYFLCEHRAIPGKSKGDISLTAEILFSPAFEISSPTGNAKNECQ